MVTKLTDGKFPDLDRVFPRHPSKFVINRDGALAALRSVMGCADEKFSGSVMDVANGKVRFCVKNDADEAESEIEAVGDLGLTVGVNVKYLYEAIEAQGESVEVHWLNDTAAVVFGGSALTEVIMPMRV